MMGRTRIARRVDVGRLGSALKRPGIDTRCWVSLAIALGDSVVDPDGLGAFVDVQLMPTEEELTARFGPVYAGEGFGLFSRIREDDELVVLIPSGVTAEGPVVVSRLWSDADKVPQEVIDNPEDFVLVVEEGKSLRFKLTGGGEVRYDLGDGKNQVIITEDLVELGAEGAGDKAALDSKVQTELNRLQADLDALKGTYNAHSVTVSVPALGLLDSLGLPVTGAATGTSAPPGDAAAIQAIEATNSDRVTIDK